MYVYRWFVDIKNVSPNPRITHMEIESWARLNRVQTDPIEVNAILLIDKLHMSKQK